MRTILALAATLALAPAIGLAQDALESALDYVDVDGNDIVTEEEFVTRMNSLFDQLDTSGDSAINRSEATATMSRELFDGADTDGSGWISRAEYEAQVRRDFRTADIDNDGTLE